MDDEKRRDIALFRYVFVSRLADPDLSAAGRGRLVRELASVDHLGPFGEYVRVSRPTLDRWHRAYRCGGFDALMPKERSSTPVTPVDVLELAVDLKRQAPDRTATQVCRLIVEAYGSAPSPRTLQRHFKRCGLGRRRAGSPARVYGRFEADAPNDLWTGDALHGPKIGVRRRKIYLFAFVDDHSRLLCGYRWGYSEDTIRLEYALRAGLQSRGIPAAAYVDNGSAFVSKQLLSALGRLGIRMIHSPPGEPAGRGKIERFFRTVRDQFLVELDAKLADSDIAASTTIDDVNRWFTAWVEQVYHHQTHSETGQSPLERWRQSAPTAPIPTPDRLTEAFLWSETRTVTKTATVNLHGNVYEVDAVLVGRKVELRFDPFDLINIDVYYQNLHMGTAIVHTIGRWTRHPNVPAETDDDKPTPAPGIDYLTLVAQRYDNSRKCYVDFDKLTAPTSNDSNDSNDSNNESEPQ